LSTKLTANVVSVETSIAVAFGILQTLISIFGVIIGYLTLRTMSPGRGKLTSMFLMTFKTDENCQLLRSVNTDSRVGSTITINITILRPRHRNISQMYDSDNTTHPKEVFGRK
jgi:hypothetical protein